MRSKVKVTRSRSKVMRSMSKLQGQGQRSRSHEVKVVGQVKVKNCFRA